MRSWKDYIHQRIRLIIENKIANEVVSHNMVGIHELMTDDDFLNWFDKLSERVLKKFTMYEIYKQYQDYKKKQK